jgi:formylglycine-generating enzyme required for sulfatase activity
LRADARRLLEPPPAPLPEAYRDELNRGYDAFVLVPAGTFWMGAQRDDPNGPAYDPEARPDEGPPRRVTLPAFRVMRFEASESTFRECVDAGWCAPDDAATPNLAPPVPSPVPGSAAVGDRPVTSIAWSAAARLCDWLGARLPTEAEWERMARGDEGRRYPWGEAARCGLRATVGDPNPTSCTLTALPTFADLEWSAAYGIMGAGGSVWEWVEDAYAPYPTGPAHDPRVPDGERRVQRGGGWLSVDPSEMRGAARGALPPDTRLPDLGVRCARDEAP